MKWFSPGAGLWGLLIFVVVALAEGLGALMEAQSGGMTLALYLAIGAPTAILAGIASGLIFAAWRRQTDGQPWVHAIRWLSGEPLEIRRSRTTKAVYLLVVLGIVGLSTLLAGDYVHTTIATGTFAALVLFLVQLSVASILLIAYPLVARPIDTLVGFVPELLIRPGVILILIILGGLGGVFSLPFLAPAVSDIFPWFTFWGLCAGLVLASTIIYLASRKKALPYAGGGFMLLLLATSVAVLGFLPVEQSDLRGTLLGKGLVPTTWGLMEPGVDRFGSPALARHVVDDCDVLAPDIDPQTCSGSGLFPLPSTGSPLAQRPDAIQKSPHIFLLTTDALSFPHTTPGGYERDTTPNLADWASRATVFQHAFSNSTSTRLAMPGLVASLFNAETAMKPGRRHPYRYQDEVVTIGSVLSSAGYTTVHIPGNEYFTRWGGYTRGIEHIDRSAITNPADPIHTAPELTEAALRWIDEHDTSQPLFLWMHYYDHHGPYRVPKGAKTFGEGNQRVDRFDSELHFADQHWKMIFEAIEERFEPDEYILIFTSDHGEAFDENHPRQHHDFSVFTRPLHVPLIIQAPKGRGRVVGGLAGHIDVLPTIATLVEYEPEENWRGESLVPVIFEGKEPQKEVIYSTFYVPERVRRNQDGFSMVGVRTMDYYWFEDRRQSIHRLVDWKSDPIDTVDLSLRRPAVARFMRYVAAEFMRDLRDKERGLTEHYRK